ncbi:MAG: ABC transporter permease, partial [Lachnospiraceae bacterium]|nr:ABC transporter permease [Lachnospiraceae bacterium]
NVYVNFAPYIESVAEKKLGIFDGGYALDSQSEQQLAYLRAIGTETGYDPVLEVLDSIPTTSLYRGKEITTYSYKVKVNSYYKVGVKNMVISYDDYNKIVEYQDKTGIQVLYPIVEISNVYPEGTDPTLVNENPNIWFKCKDTKGTIATDENGNPVPAYTTDQAKQAIEYNSLRIESDPGTYIYNLAKSGAVQVRICYYNYYTYKNGHIPEYIFGTDVYGRDLFVCIGVGSRFSLVFALIVSAINLTIGAVYGAIQGYYGGAIDMALDRFADILGNLPMIVVTTLFQLHLATKVGSVGAFLFAFVLTGWLGMAALTRKQFYRFKGQEYVLAARTLGASDKRVMFKHIFPNSLGTIVTSCVLTIPGVIRSETTLTYLGIINMSDFAGTSIGELFATGQSAMTTSPHALFYPAIYLSLLLICFNLFGNGLRDAFNPSTKGE